MGGGGRRKKLRSVARALVEGGEDDLAADAAAFGIRLPDAAKADDSLLVLPDNWPAVTLFCQCRTQWRYGPSGAPTGLDYASCYRVATALEIDWQEQFTRLTVLEVETIDIVNRRSEANQGRRRGEAGVQD